MEDATEETLEHRLEAAQEEAEKEEEYVEEIESIKYEIQDAREEETLEELQARYRERRDELAEERDRDYEEAVGSVLAGLVQEETRDQGLPPGPGAFRGDHRPPLRAHARPGRRGVPGH
jgi:hypothetical protein